MDKLEKRILGNLVTAFTVIPLIISIIVLLGYAFEKDALINVVPFFPPMSFMISPIFILTTLSIFAIKLGNNKVAKIAGIMVVIFSSAGLINLILDFHWSLDLIKSRKIMPGYTFVALFLLGLGVFFCSRRDSHLSTLKIIVTSAVLLLVSSRTIFIYLFYPGDPMKLIAQGMAIATAAGLTCFAFSLFFLSAFIDNNGAESVNPKHPIIRMLRSYSVRSKFLILSLTLVGGLMIFATATVKRFIESNQAWSEYSDEVVARQDRISRIQELLGYGGGSAYFKNLVLRGSPETIQEAQKGFNEILKVVGEYIQLKGISENEELALQEIKELLTKYLFNIDLVRGAQGRGGGMSPGNVEGTLFLDDQRARAAINELKSEIRVRLADTLERVQRSRQMLLVVCVGGFLFAIGLILVFSYLINNTLVTTIANATQTAKDIANENFEGQIWMEGEDEIGHLMKDLSVMRQRIKESRLTILNKSEDLARSNAFLNSIFENLPSMVYLKDAKNLKYTHFNRAGEKLVGLDRQSVLGQNDFDILPRMRAEEARKSDQMALISKGLIEIPEEKLELKSGGVRVLNTKKIPIVDSNGIPSHVLGISEDVTERQRLERSLKEQKERLNLVLRDSQIVAWDWNIKTDIFSGDESFFDFLGMRRAASVGINLATMMNGIPADERSLIAMGVLEAVRKKKDFNFKFRYLRPTDLSLRTYMFKGKIYTDYSGRPDFASGIINDLTEKSEQESFFKMSKERFSRLFSRAPIGVLVIDSRGNVLEANDAFLRMVNYINREIGACNWAVTLTPPEWEAVDNKARMEVIDRGWTSVFDKELYRRDKTKFPVQVAMSRIDASGNNIVIFVRSLVRERGLESQSRSIIESLELSQQEFAYIIDYLAEEARNPIKNIITAAAHLEDEEGSQKIADAGLNIDATLESLTSYFYIKTESAIFGKIEVGQLLSEIIGDLKPMLKGREIRITPSTLPTVYGGETSIRHLFHIILLLSIRRSDKAGGEISIQASDVDGGFEFIIKGPGEPISKQLNSPNLSLAEIRQIENKQYGLALLCCKKIIENHHGKIWLAQGSIGFLLPKSSQDTKRELAV